MLINTQVGKFTIIDIIKLLVNKKLTIKHFILPNNAFNLELINIHLPNVQKTKFIHILYYLILYPEYYNIIEEFCKRKLIIISEVTIHPDNIIDPINFCHPIYIKLLYDYGFTCDLNTTKNKFIEGVLSYQMIKQMIDINIINPKIFFNNVKYDEYLNHMIISIIAAKKSLNNEKQNIIIEQYMLGLGLLFKYSSEKFNTMHFNKILTCNDINIVKRVLRYIKLHPTNFNIIYSNLNSINVFCNFLVYFLRFR
ncbi:MAG: hypothetical protein IJ997_01440, partial [Mycoplasmataceae bacterium]|nr:hypothetical protein [Mycoplasmataceae bacterium]